MRPRKILLPFLIAAAFLSGQFLFAYTCNKDKAGPIEITVEKIEKITAFDTPADVRITLRSEAETPVRLGLTARSIDTVKIIGEAKKEVDVPAKGTAEAVFQVACEPGTFSAHYPVHVFGTFEFAGRSEKLQPVQVFETDFGPLGVAPRVVGRSDDGTEVKLGEVITDAARLPVFALPEQGGLFLPNLQAQRVVWNFDGGASHFLPIGFSGTDETSRVSFVPVVIARGGIVREAFSVHPPWFGGPGTLFAEYRIRLPKAKPIRLSYYAAMRDLSPGEPESDGITFRTWVDDQAVHSANITDKNWVPVEVDLSSFAGKEILLRLESDPGPARDTTCDNGFWGDPLLFCGDKPKLLLAAEKTALFAENLKAVQTGKSPSDQTLVYDLDGGLRAAVTFGNHGFLDGVIGLGNEKEQVQYDGLRVWLEGQQLGSLSSSHFCGDWTHNATASTATESVFEQRIRSAGGELNMRYAIRKNGPAVQLSVECDKDEAITNIEFGPTTQHANRVYFGHGYCIEEPDAFQMTDGGHGLSTSHVGADFENGLSLLMGTTFPPEHFKVDPKINLYTLSVYPGTTLTLLPGTKGAIDCAIRYRPIYDKKAAPGTAKKAGRFAFDWWGGRFADQTKILQQCIDYGITDALVINHNWQHWGYDNRLPDIWPPNPRIGTTEEIKETIELCKKHGILYGLHDNYIDFYPDADDFSYSLTAFEKSGLPKKGWNNYGIEAQSYQFLPKNIFPFLKRNFDLMSPNLEQTTYFVDVFASINLMNYWDRDGKLHSRRETLDCWNRAFDDIRERLGNDNPTISEAGSDFLIGHLDGADCQFLLLSPHSGDFRIPIKCKNWSRVPWFDAVNHTRLALHGVGYDSRYVANRGYDLHGYASDDYLTAEVLTGHALQVGIGTPLRDVVRKYWLLQPLMRQLADQEIESVEFADGNINRLIIQWSGDTTIFVNRGKEDWELGEDMFNAFTSGVFQEAILPQYGFQAIFRLGNNCGIFSENGQIVEGFIGMVDSKAYVNLRRKVARDYLPVLPIAEKFESLGENRFRFDMNWKVFRPLTKRNDMRDYACFIHLEEPQYAWFHKPKMIPVGSVFPTLPSSQWEKDQTVASGELLFPKEFPSGTYNVLVGFWDASGDQSRPAVLGLTPDNSRVQIGRLTVEKQGDNVVKMSFEPTTEDAPELFERLLPNDNVIAGACRSIIKQVGVMEVTPLPDEPAFDYYMPEKKVQSVLAVDREGKILREVPIEHDSESKYSKFTTREGEFRYILKANAGK